MQIESYFRKRAALDKYPDWFKRNLIEININL